MAQSVNNIHKLFKVDELKKELLKLLFGTQIELKFPEEGVSPIIESTPWDKEIRHQLFESEKAELQGNKWDGTTRLPKTWIPNLYWKIIKHKMNDEEQG